jgi:carbonic anhydrase/acetyltransferase-like protein (isoleucine patch superfamily)
VTAYALGNVSPTLHPEGCWIAPSASVIGNVKLERHASVWFAAVLRGDNDPIIIGEDSNIQDGCIMHTDPGFAMIVGRGCTVGHQAILHGCIIGDNSLIGMGATVLTGARIGKNCLIGANALVTEGKEIPDGSMVLGAPGKIIRQLSEDEIRRNAKAAAHYVANWQRFEKELRPLS